MSRDLDGDIGGAGAAGLAQQLVTDEPARIHDDRVVGNRRPGHEQRLPIDQLIPFALGLEPCIELVGAHQTWNQLLLPHA